MRPGGSGGLSLRRSCCRTSRAVTMRTNGARCRVWYSNQFSSGKAILTRKVELLLYQIIKIRLFRGLLAYIDTPPTKTGRSRRYPNQFSSGLEGGQFMKPFVGWYTFKLWDTC